MANQWLWLGFIIFIIAALSVDSFFLSDRYPRPHHSMRAALCWSLIWVASALLFNVLLWGYLFFTTTITFADEQALIFFTGYLIEKSLSFDNLFAFYIIFNYFQLPPSSQQRVLSYGIWSAIVMRLLLILLGSWLVVHFHWLLYVMGAFLFLTGIRLLFMQKKSHDLNKSVMLKMIRKLFRITEEHNNKQFFVIKNKHYYLTPLFIALIFIEISDLIFAIDSIPAIFAITQDPFIVYSSNIFAILGLRAMYFLLAGMLKREYFLKYGIAAILIFIGFKMLIEPWIAIPIFVSLTMVIGIIVFCFLVNHLYFVRTR